MKVFFTLTTKGIIFEETEHLIFSSPLSSLLRCISHGPLTWYSMGFSRFFLLCVHFHFSAWGIWVILKLDHESWHMNKGITWKAVYHMVEDLLSIPVTQPTENIKSKSQVKV